MAGDIPGRVEFNGEQIPVYEFPENAARALGKVVSYARWRDTPLGMPREFPDVSAKAARAVCQSVLASRGQAWLTEEEMRRVLAAYGVTLAPTAFARTAEAAIESAEAMGFPVVAKLVSSQVTHKSDLGGVLLNLDDVDAVREAFRALRQSADRHGVPFDGVSIQPMLNGGVETMIGVVHDRLFGPIIGFGMGGTDVEVLGDMRFRLAPLVGRDVAELIAESRAGRLLAAHRGKPAADIEALGDLLSRISALAQAVPEILELDLNPVIVKAAGHGCHIVDARIRVFPNETAGNLRRA
jgi:acetyltransferase